MAGRRAKGTGSVFRNPDGTWTGQCVKGFCDKGYTKFKRFKGKTKAEVIRKMENYLMLVKSGGQYLDDYYLDDYLCGWMEHIKKPDLKPTSYDRAMLTVKKHINPYIGHYRVTQLTPAIIQLELIDTLRNRGLSLSTVRKAYVYLNACLTYAVDAQGLPQNPCRLVKLRQKDFPAKKNRFFSEKEMTEFIKAANSLDNSGKPRYSLRKLLVLDIYTGLRVGELAALKWSDVDFEHKMLNVSKNVVSTYNFGRNEGQKQRIVQDSTKSRNRIVPLNKSALALLEEMYESSADKSGYILGGKAPVSVNSLINTYKRVCKRAGIENCCGIHTLRHTFASLLFLKGVDIKVISDILGHADTGFTYNTYIHLTGKQTELAVEKLDAI